VHTSASHNGIFSKTHFSFLFVYEVVVSKLNQREVYFELMLTVLNYI